MWPDQVSNPRPLTYESGAISTAHAARLPFHLHLLNALLHDKTKPFQLYGSYCNNSMCPIFFNFHGTAVIDQLK